jgi:hypothetical protein
MQKVTTSEVVVIAEEYLWPKRVRSVQKQVLVS